jgi:hypothetical protein
MKNQAQQNNSQQRDRIPQLRIRSSVSVGASLDNCLQNLDYWKKQYHKMCGGY